MQKRFAKTMEELRGLINIWSAPLCNHESFGSRAGQEAGKPVILLAVSGGIDSMCMADLFAGAQLPVGFAVAHCNFRLRGEESDADEDLVRSWAYARGVELHVRHFETEEYARENGISIEMAARDLRYGWFAGLCHEHGYKAVAVAHNANDNAETLMLNMLRGSGLRGLSGMSVVSQLPLSPDITLIRPLLDCTRKQIEGYAFVHKIEYREDRTNAMSDYKRNRIRNEAFPIFSTVNPSFVRTLNREMGYFTEAGEIVEDWCRNAALGLAAVSEDGTLRVDLPSLMGKKHWKYLLYHILEPYGFNSSSLASLEDLLTSGRTVSGKRFDSATHRLLTAQDSLVVVPVTSVEETPADPAVMPVRCAGTYRFNGKDIRVEILPWTGEMPLKQPDGTLLFDAAALPMPFVLRRWRSGDWLIPLGMKGKKKVSDLFADLKYDSLQKEAAIMIVDVRTESMAAQQHVCAVAGVRIDDRCKVTSATSQVVRISFI
ncbi:MAG: tRNA lysidine(34) synthetase TilS [Bacteroidales bacterium]|nr:tRNA lysidine(34) synthetase TilS [Bacteroidales bacterium]